jgi:isopentenyldiphosphate isomerase
MTKSSSSFTSQLFWGLIPLVVFILAESLFETTISAIISVSCGLLIFGVQYIREKHVDKFLVLDILILAILGAATALFDSELFLKLKPGFTQILFLIYLAVILYGKADTFKGFIERFSFGKMAITNETVLLLRKNMQLMLYVLLLHTALVVYAAFYWSMTVCVFLSGVGFFIAVGIAVFIPLISRWLKNMNTEFVPVVNEQGNIIGKAARDYVHNGSKALHPVVHVHVLNSSGQLFLQQRSKKAKIQPGKWDTAVGGHVKWKESIEQALAREMFEETRLKPRNINLLVKYIWNSEVESELVFSFLQITDSEPRINPSEAEQGRWWTFQQIAESPKEIFTPNFLHELPMIKTMLEKYRKGGRGV